VKHIYITIADGELTPHMEPCRALTAKITPGLPVEEMLSFARSLILAWLQADSHDQEKAKNP